MATYTTSNMLTEVRLFVKTCDDDTLLYAINQAIREFCRESEEYQQTINLTLVNDLEVYRLDVNTGDEIVRVKDVKYNDYPLQSSRPEDVWFTKTGDQPFTYIFEPPDLLMLKPVPHNVSGAANNGQTNLSNVQGNVLAATKTTPDVCLVRVVLQPTESNTNVPDLLYRDYKQYIAAGAAAWCLNMPGESWSNPQLAAQKQAYFKYGYNEGKRRRLFGHTSRGVRIRPRSFIYS